MNPSTVDEGDNVTVCITVNRTLVAFQLDPLFALAGADSETG